MTQLILALNTQGAPYISETRLHCSHKCVLRNMFSFFRDNSNLSAWKCEKHRKRYPYTRKSPHEGEGASATGVDRLWAVLLNTFATKRSALCSDVEENTASLLMPVAVERWTIYSGNFIFTCHTGHLSWADRTIPEIDQECNTCVVEDICEHGHIKISRSGFQNSHFYRTC